MSPCRSKLDRRLLWYRAGNLHDLPPKASGPNAGAFGIYVPGASCRFEIPVANGLREFEALLLSPATEQVT